MIGGGRNRDGARLAAHWRWEGRRATCFELQWLVRASRGGQRTSRALLRKTAPQMKTSMVQVTHQTFL